MASKRKFKRDYIILEAKDTNFRYKERILPKAFAKVEISEEKSIVSLYVENLKSVRDGYKVVAIQNNYETLDLGRVVLSEQGKGEFVLNLEKDDIEIKGIALLHERCVPLIGFKGSKIENYEDILFTNDSYEVEDEYEEYEEYEYIEVEDVEELEDEYEEYEEIEYIEIEDEIEEDEIQECEEVENMEYIDTVKEINKRNNKYQEYDNVEEAIARNMVKPKESQNKSKNSSQQRPSINQNTQNTQNQPNKQINKKSTEKSAGALLMPRQIKKGLKYFNEVKPFVSEDIEDTRWWKIEINPTTLCGYTMPYLGYVNSLNYTMYSDIVMNSYKYRHYLFGVQYDEYNKRKNYVYAIPGNKDDQPDKGHTGFTTYQACDTRDDKLGYWICFIDSRTRRIIK